MFAQAAPDATVPVAIIGGATLVLTAVIAQVGIWLNARAVKREVHEVHELVNSSAAAQEQKLTKAVSLILALSERIEHDEHITGLTPLEKHAVGETVGALAGPQALLHPDLVPPALLTTEEEPPS